MSEPLDDGDDRASQIEEATAEVCQFQERSERAWHAADSAKDAAKLAVDEAKGADSDLRDAARRLRKLREGRFPDPEKFPLFDPKAALNAEFSPAEDDADTEEAERRLREEGHLAVPYEQVRGELGLEGEGR